MDLDYERHTYIVSKMGVWGGGSEWETERMISTDDTSMLAPVIMMMMIIIIIIKKSKASEKGCICV